MKKNISLILGLLIALSLTACTPSPSENGSATGLDAESQRSATTVLKVMQGGTAEDVAATLYVGGGYSVYIPDEGWTQNSTLEQDGTDCWAADAESKALFQIARFTGVKAEDAQKRLMQDFQGPYDLQPAEHNRYVGSSGGETAVFQLIGEIGNDYYYLVQLYPTQAAIEYGATMDAIAETFQIE